MLGRVVGLTGLNSDKSPLHSLTLASVRVLTRPYPMGIPAKMNEFSTTNSRIWARGRKARKVSSLVNTSYRRVHTDPTVAVSRAKIKSELDLGIKAYWQQRRYRVRSRHPLVYRLDSSARSILYHCSHRLTRPRGVHATINVVSLGLDSLDWVLLTRLVDLVQVNNL